MKMTLSLRRQSALLALMILLGSACASAPPPGRVYVVDRPPPIRVEAISARPGPAYVWVGGYWHRAGSGWDWTPGRYLIPEGRYHRWVSGRWVRDRRGWYFVEGRWR